MVTVEVARQLVLAHSPVLPSERLPLMEAHQRVLAEAIASPISVPPFANSQMDGYALIAAEGIDTPSELPVVFEVAAGGRPERPLVRGEACRIMTGAPLPQGADAVVPIEDVEVLGDRIRLREPVASGDYVRPAGQDVRAGHIVLKVGDELSAAKIGLLAAVGIDRVSVYRRPRVAILTSGDELVEPGVPLGQGQIYNSNAYAMAAMVREAGALPVMLGIARDDREVTQALIRQALHDDLVLSSGGVSVGAYDFVGELLGEMGQVHFSRVAQQPGKPLTFAVMEGKPYFGLPGNPVSTMVALEVYVRPALRKMMGHRDWFRPRVPVALEEGVEPSPDKVRFLRARVCWRGSQFSAALTGLQGSHLITSMAGANALLPVPPGREPWPAGSRLEAWLLEPGAILGAPC